jgi:hypothetical protein
MEVRTSQDQCRGWNRARSPVHVHAHTAPQWLFRALVVRIPSASRHSLRNWRNNQTSHLRTNSPAFPRPFLPVWKAKSETSTCRYRGGHHANHATRGGRLTNKSSGKVIKHRRWPAAKILWRRFTISQPSIKSQRSGFCLALCQRSLSTNEFTSH